MAFDVVGRNAILRDPAYHDGQYYGNGPGPTVGLSIARMLGHITYLSREAMIEKFDAHRLQPRQVQTQFETRFSVGSYLAYQGDKFVERFDANSYLALTMAIDLFDLGDSREELRRALSSSQCRWLLMSFSTDWLFPPFQSEKMVNALIAEGKPVSYCNVKSNCGHDAFLLADELPIYGEAMRAFLANLDAATPADDTVADVALDELSCQDPTSIFHSRRLDYDSIVELIPPGGERAGPRLRQRRAAWPGCAATAAGTSWASSWTRRRSWPASAAGWTSCRPTWTTGCRPSPTGSSTSWSFRRRCRR